MAPAGGLVVIDLVSMLSQMPALLLAFKHFSALAYHDQITATRASVRWWLENADIINSLRDTLPGEIIAQEGTQQSIWQTYQAPGDIRHTILGVGSDIRALRAIGESRLEAGARKRELVVLHKTPVRDYELEVTVDADVFDLCFPALVHAYEKWFGTDEQALNGAIDWWLANATELEDRARVCTAIGMLPSEIGQHAWEYHHAAGQDIDSEMNLPLLVDYAN